MAREDLVRGLPDIEQVNQLCDAYLASKQRWSSFQSLVQWRAERSLEMVHEDLCGPISPTTPSGSNYFLLLLDDQSRFMWVNTLANKAQAAAVIMDFQSRAERESGYKLKALRTDHGGNSIRKPLQNTI
jgi:hypothetical protein